MEPISSGASNPSFRLGLLDGPLVLCRLGGALLLIILTVYSWSVQAGLPSIEVVPGYTDQPLMERHHDYEPFEVPLEVMKEQTRASIEMTYSPQVFNPRLSRELRGRYRRTFGDGEFEHSHRLPVVGGEDYWAFRQYHLPRRQLELERNFGEYVVRRLGEHHLDAYLQESPQGQVVYEAKERVQNANFSVSESVRIRARYSIITEQVDVSITHPVLESRILWDPSSTSPYLLLTRNMTQTLRLQSRIDWGRERYQLSASERLTPLLTTSVSVMTRKRSPEIQEHTFRATVAYSWL